MVENYEVTVSGYTFDIAPILNVIIAFVKKILDANLPDDVKDILTTAEEA